MSTSPEVAIDLLAERACAALAAFPDEVVFPAVAGLELGVGIEWNEHGNAVTYETPRKIFADASALREAIVSSTKEARICALPALGTIDKTLAAPIFGELVWLRTENFYAMSYSANLVRAMWTHWTDLMALLPPDVPGKMWLEGRFRFEALTDAQIAALPAGDLEAKLGRLGGSEIGKIFDVHPAFASVATQKAIVGSLLEARALRPAAAIIGRLVAQKDEEAPALAARYLEASHPEDHAAVDLVVRAHHVPSLERLFAMLPETRDRAKPRWDPYHTDQALRPAIRAGLALDYSTAATRFEAYFTEEAVASEVGAKVAYDVWMLAAGRAVSHDGTELASGDGDILGRDPAWFSVAARMASHRRLGKTAKQILARLPKDERAALLKAHGVEREAPPKKVVPKKEAAKKAAPKKVVPKKSAPKKK